MDTSDKNYDPQPLTALLQRLVAERGESLRKASLNAGLDRSALFRFTEEGRRPSRESLIVLGAYFGVNPNVLLELAGYTPLALFAGAEQRVPPEMQGIVSRLLTIPDAVTRSRVISALEVLLEGWTMTEAPEHK
ncbi:MAG TPA: hypothetical protein PKV82_13580 [Anaerolineae bacterium]|nr:hypothetical protein [Anaerolineae bacterium]